MDLMWTALRVVVSLAAVLALVWLLGRAARRRGAGGAASVESLAVIGRQSLGRGVGVAVLRVGDQALVLGITEQSVRLLTQAPLAQLVATAPDTEVRSDVPVVRSEVPVVPAVTVVPGVPAQRSASPLAGSALSPATWARAVDVLRERTTRR